MALALYRYGSLCGRNEESQETVLKGEHPGRKTLTLNVTLSHEMSLKSHFGGYFEMCVIWKAAASDDNFGI